MGANCRALVLAGVSLVLAGSLAPLQSAAAAQSNRGYQLDVISNTKDVRPGQPAAIKYRIKDARGQVVKDFAVVHDKMMHLIVVRKDLREFQHLHPDYDQTTGEFALDITFPTAGPYRIFPDFTPGKTAGNPQLLPVTLTADIAVGTARSYKAQPVVPDTAAKKMADGYEVSFDFPRELRAASDVEYSLTVAKDGQPVNDLEPYLGALGHSVILKADTLDYIHTHAEPGKDTGPKLTFATSFPAAGKYKTFTQFQHQGKVFTVDHVISVAPNRAKAKPAGQHSHGAH